jgi:uridine kinase
MMPKTTAETRSVSLTAAVDTIDMLRRTTPSGRGLLVAVTGIDGCGKGSVAALMTGTLEGRGLRTVNINVDGWLNLPSVRFSEKDPAAHFYFNALRFDEMFATLVKPLRAQRSILLEANFVEETDVEYRRHLYEFADVDVIVLEGIYLLKRELREEYDLSIWIDCSFETALERAVARSQENLPPAETISAYHRIYFPAQEIHARRDRPRDAATLIVTNDPRL